MITIIPDEELQQGSELWKSRRNTWLCGGTDACIIAGEPAPFVGSTKSWKQKRDRPPSTGGILDNPAVNHGRKYEEAARKYFTNDDPNFQPVVFEREIADGIVVGASLDAWSSSSKRAIEIKCPYSQSKSSAYTMVRDGIGIPRHYYWQVVMQALCGGEYISNIAFAVYLSDDPLASVYRVYSSESLKSDISFLEQELLRYASGAPQYEEESFDDLSDKYVEIERQRRILESSMQSLNSERDKIRSKLLEHSTSENSLLKVVTVKGRSTFDKKAFSENFPHMFRRFSSKGKPQIRIQVKD